MPVVRIKRYEEVEVTAENEMTILGEEWDRRYADREFSEGDTVEFITNGRAKLVEFFGPEHIGKRGIVSALGEGDSVKVLAIALDGSFVEAWTRECDIAAVAD